MTHPSSHTMTLLQRWGAALRALLLRLACRWRSPRATQPYRRPAHAPLRDNEFN
jgi:hypothetical protein